MLDLAGNSQTERREIDRGMTVVLRREKVILRRHRLQLADVEHTNDFTRIGREVRRDVRERHQRFAFSEGRHRPLGDAEGRKSGGRQTALENISTSRHKPLTGDPARIAYENFGTTS